MAFFRYLTGLSHRHSTPLLQLLATLVIALVLGLGPGTQAWQEARQEQTQQETISAPEFARLIREMSEEDGFFRSDNFVSNETSYLHVIEKLRELGAQGGAYVGVGPEQNFTYIAKVRPRIAFIVDIRRQAIIQHLMFKAIFHQSPNRVEFLGRLFCRPLGEGAPDADASAERLMAYFEDLGSSDELFSENLTAIQKAIEEDYRFPMSARDRATLEYVYTAFRQENIHIQYRSGGGNWGGPQFGYFPTFKDLVLGTDLHGKLGSFLAREEDYQFVRSLQVRNRIIPIVGDFAGPKALAAVGEYLRKNAYTLTAFYTSNVEQYLFANTTFTMFAENVRRLPLTEKSLFIRSFPNMRDTHPARISGHRLTTLLQKMNVFLQDFDQGLYQDYLALVTTHYIAGDDR